ncbi:MAG: SH3 domain-containing protein [Eubacteriales bacterium]|nr:SH3 domain-containing protein [Eubacteriales bacterium]
MKFFQKKPKPYEPPMQIDKYWPIYRENVFVDKKKSRLPNWVAPLITLAAIILIVFYLAPTISRRVLNLTQNRDNNGQQISRHFTDLDRVVLTPVADVYAAPDIKASRVVQVLFNEPVKLVETPSQYGFLKIQLQDGLTGYMREMDLSTFCDAAEPSLAVNKLVVATGSKRIMSHAKTGTLVAEVMMGTVLYADYRGDGISRVLLPSGESGWISDDGLVILPPDGAVLPVTDGARYLTTTALTFLNVTTLDHGMTIYGASVPGIAYVSAAVNGVAIPRQMSGQIQMGQSIPLVKDTGTDLVDPRILKPGDLLFFSRSGSISDLHQMAICITPNSLMVENQGRSSIRLLDPAKDETLWRTVVAVRRLFPAVEITGTPADST